jgi:hypothetical protein
MTKRKDRQYNDQKKGQIIQWPQEITDNAMTKRKKETIQCYQSRDVIYPVLKGSGSFNKNLEADNICNWMF